MRAIRAIAEALFATEAGAPPTDRLDWLELEMEDFMARAGAQSRLALSLSARVVSLVAPVLSGRLARFENLPLEQRIRALTVLERRFGEPLLALKAILCLVYYEHPAAAREVGYDAQCLVASERTPNLVTAERLRQLGSGTPDATPKDAEEPKEAGP